MKLSEIAEVTVSYETSMPSTYHILVADLDLFFAATIKLHYNPGRNPHNGVPTARASRIEARKLEVDDEYLWWTDPMLGVLPNENVYGAEREAVLASLRTPEQVAAGRSFARKIIPTELIREWRSPEQIDRDNNYLG